MSEYESQLTRRRVPQEHARTQFTQLFRRDDARSNDRRRPKWRDRCAGTTARAASWRVNPPTVYRVTYAAPVGQIIGCLAEARRRSGKSGWLQGGKRHVIGGRRSHGNAIHGTAAEFAQPGHRWRHRRRHWQERRQIVGPLDVNRVQWRKMQKAEKLLMQQTVYRVAQKVSHCHKSPLNRIKTRH